MPEWQGQSRVGSNGQASVSLTHNKSGIVWQIEQITAITGQVSSACTAFIKKNGIVKVPSAALTPVDTGQAATAAGLPYQYLTASDQLTIQVQGANSGDTLTVNAQYREFLDSDREVRGV